MEYLKKKSTPQTMRFLGHKKVENTIRYIQLEHIPYKESDDYICKISGQFLVHFVNSDKGETLK